jgi:hypothetical protein
MNKTTENFLTAIKNYTPPQVEQTVYKLVYNIDTGKPICVTTDNTDLPWVEISREFADSQPQLDPRVTVVENKIVIQTKKIKEIEEPGRLLVVKDCNGNIATDDYSMLIINSEGNNRWSYE